MRSAGIVSEKQRSSQYERLYAYPTDANHNYGCGIRRSFNLRWEYSEAVDHSEDWLEQAIVLPYQVHD